MFYNYDIDQILRENFDITDKTTRKYLVSLEEEDKSAVATALAAALYDKIVKKVDDIDFGTIPRSMGDITKIDGFQNTTECLDIIKKLVLEYKESTETVDVVINAIENIKARKALFMKGFSLNAPIVMTTYNLIVLAIEHSVSFLISVCIEYIKNNDTNTMDMALDKAAYNNAQDNLLFQQVASFNTSCGSGELDSAFSELLKAKPVKEDGEIYIGAERDPNRVEIIDKTDNNSGLFSGEFDYNEPTNIEPIIPEADDPDITSDEVDYEFNEDETKPAFDVPVNTNEAAFSIAAIWGGLTLAQKILVGTGLGLALGGTILKGSVFIVKVLLPKLRNLSYFFIHSRVKLSDTLAIQAQMLEMNAYNLQYDNDSSLDETKRQKVASKQLKVANNLKKWSNKFAIDNKTAEKKVEVEVKEDDKKITINSDGEILF